jgi:hypothetical protein
MSIKITVNNEEETLDLTETEDSFYLTNISGIKIEVESPLNLDRSHKNKDYEVHILAKKDIKENDVFEIYRHSTDCRIGWLIPALSLGSDLHDFNDNRHFLRYAYIAMREALNLNGEDLYSKKISTEGNSVLFSDLFHEETAFLVLSKETYEDGYSFDLDRASPTLIDNGYIKFSSRNPDDIKHLVTLPNSLKRIHLKEISNEISDQSLISELLNKSFSYESNSIFKFFYLYQIFELLIDTIYKNEQTSLVDEVVVAKGDSGKTKDALEKLQQFMSEKKRFELLTKTYSIGIEGELNELKIACNSLLADLNRSPSAKFSKYFYGIRNFIFHQYRDFPEDSLELLDDVLKELVSLIPSILSMYSNPDS